ncbi:unnamed protein product, partial [Effrenium voratum]
SCPSSSHRGADRRYGTGPVNRLYLECSWTGTRRSRCGRRRDAGDRGSGEEGR